MLVFFNAVSLFFNAVSLLRGTQSVQGFSIAVFTVLSSVHNKYQDLQEIFSKDKVLFLRSHRPYDSAIELLPSAPLPSSRIYNLSRPRRKAVENYILKSLAAGIIRPSSSLVGARHGPTPTSRKHLHLFLGFANFHWHFIRSYSQVAAPLTSTKILLIWSPEAKSAFLKSKQQFTSAPVLVHPDTTKPFVVGVDASDTRSQVCTRTKGMACWHPSQITLLQAYSTLHWTIWDPSHHQSYVS